MRSMTGYGRGTASLGAYQLVVETASVNKKNLDVAVYLPREWQRLEIEVANRVRKRVGRGRVTVSVSLQTAETESPGAFDSAAVSENMRQLEALARKLDVPFEPTVDLLYRVATSPSNRAAAPDADAVIEPLGEALAGALDGLLAMRETEGQALRKDLEERGATLKKRVGEIREHSSDAAENYRESLFKRLRQAGLELDLDDERVLREIALFADRVDISEELTRLDSHLSQWTELLGATEPVGRQFEFLLQEVGREFNTIGSKANHIAVSRCVIESKNDLEKMREQIQNVE